jgi:hypothetical protein
MKNWVALASIGVAAGFVGSAIADDLKNPDRQKSTFRAELVGLNEVPSVSTAAHGEFTAELNAAGDALSYTVSFSDLGFDVSQSHIHFGQHHTNGGIIVWLCEGSLQAPTASTPACGGPRSSTVSGVITRAEVIGPAGQGITAMEFAELVAALRAGAAYANVHSGTVGPPVVGFPGGEIRGQIN